jgi:predicted metal-dependent peptidase
MFPSVYPTELKSQLIIMRFYRVIFFASMRADFGRLSREKRLSRRGLTDMKLIFDWLRSKDVKKIVKVMVVDDGSPSHSDDAIQEALGGLEVEVWDWKKLDMCTDVIYKSTKKVREVSLYSSGNNAVLMGWASSEGLTNVENFPKVRLSYPTASWSPVNIRFTADKSLPARARQSLYP